jgi:hypothetical protein
MRTSFLLLLAMLAWSSSAGGALRPISVVCSMAAVGAAHPTAVSRLCNRCMATVSGIGAPASLTSFTIQAARKARQARPPLRFVPCSRLWWLFQPVLFLRRLTTEERQKSEGGCYDNSRVIGRSRLECNIATRGNSNADKSQC